MNFFKLSEWFSLCQGAAKAKVRKKRSKNVGELLEK